MSFAQKDSSELLMLDNEGYEALRRAARSYREQLIVRLGGEVGLQPSEVVSIRLMDVTTRLFDGNVHSFLCVSNDGREAYLPTAVRRAIERYTASSGIDDNECLFDVSLRRVQMLVAEVAERAATVESWDELAEVSTLDLRRYHVRSLLR